MNEQQGALTGLTVVEIAGNVAVGVCAGLLASLGASVMRVETKEQATAIGAASAARKTLLAGGKTRVLLDGGSGDDATVTKLCGRADVVLLDDGALAGPNAAALRALLAADPGDRIVCTITPLGLDAPEALPAPVGEAILQALSGILATTGDKGGPPVCVGVPLTQMCSGVSSASAIVAALAVRRASGRGQRIDMALVEVLADHLRSHMPLIQAGGAVEFRLGCEHPGTCPWNAYRAQDGWVLICTAADVQWRALCDLMGREELKKDPRYVTNGARRQNGHEVNEIMAAWVGARRCADVIAAIEPVDVPVGPVSTMPQIMADPLLQRRGVVQCLPDAGGADTRVGGSVLRLSRTPGVALVAVDAPRAAGDDLPKRRAMATAKAALAAPLAGVRVVELSRYAAGPSCGQVLAALGAEVIKIEALEGEDCRAWLPAFGGVSGYFANYNLGKRSVALDLRKPEGLAGLWKLIAGADVVLQNFKPGALDRLGFGHKSVREKFPRIVYASISGYGEDGPQLPGLDTVLQGRGGLCSLIGDGNMPLRVGVSTADLMAGQFAALGILAALEERAGSGLGQHVDISMCDAIAWLTQLAWPDGVQVIGPWAMVRASDGYVVVEVQADALGGLMEGMDALQADRAAVVRHLRGRGAGAAPVLDPGEVIVQPALVRRGTVLDVPAARGEVVRVLRVPFGLQATPTARNLRVAGLGEDNAALLGTAG
jgi:crotonobetainyl-CoA:carnitine CoA-transferase CaiB-like acyl-CoA transferase